MNDFEVNCISKPDGDSRHERITHVGNTKSGWRFMTQEVIFLIEARTSSFYTMDKTTGKRADIRVVREEGKAPYLRTFADGTWNDNLLTQPECGPECWLR